MKKAYERPLSVATLLEMESMIAGSMPRGEGETEQWSRRKRNTGSWNSELWAGSRAEEQE